MNYSFLYTYIKAIILDNSEFQMNVVDTLRYNTHDFFENINCNLSLDNTSVEDIFITNLFCICGVKGEIEKLAQNIQGEILNRFYIGSNFEDSYTSQDIFTKYINTYVHYLLNNTLSPLTFSLDINDELSVLYFFGSKEFYSHPPEEIKEMIYAWVLREKPYLIGKQIITQPFYFSNLVGRKALDIVSDYDSNDLYLLLEGNIKIKLDYESVYSLTYNDTNTFQSTDLLKILHDPIYFFGYTFEFPMLFSDWFNVYLYVIALLEVDLNDLEKLRKSYTTFSNFVEENICDKIYVDTTIFNENDFWKYLNIYINDTFNFLKRF